MISVSLFLFALAAALNAVMDTLAHHHPISIFKKYTSGYFADATTTSWKNKYVNWDGGDRRRRKWILGLNKPLFLCDAWHASKSLMVTFICASIALALYAGNRYDHSIGWLAIAAVICVYGTLWNITFSLFYNHGLVG